MRLQPSQGIDHWDMSLQFRYIWSLIHVIVGGNTTYLHPFVHKTFGDIFDSQLIWTVSFVSISDGIHLLRSETFRRLAGTVEACQELEAMNSFWESATKSSVGWGPWRVL